MLENSIGFITVPKISLGHDFFGCILFVSVWYGLLIFLAIAFKIIDAEVSTEYTNFMIKNCISLKNARLGIILHGLVKKW